MCVDLVYNSKESENAKIGKVFFSRSIKKDNVYYCSIFYFNQPGTSCCHVNGLSEIKFYLI